MKLYDIISANKGNFAANEGIVYDHEGMSTVTNTINKFTLSMDSTIKNTKQDDKKSHSMAADWKHFIIQCLNRINT